MVESLGSHWNKHEIVPPSELPDGMKVLRLPLVALSLLCIVWVNQASAQGDEKSPPATILPLTSEIEKFAVNAMSKCRPASKTTNLIAGINRNGAYTLVGDLFHNGETNALIDCHIPHGIDDYGDEVSVDNVIIAKWSGRKWSLIGFIDIEPNWINHSSGRGADNNKPFWMIYLNGHPIIVVAGMVEKEGQNFSCFLIDQSGKNILDSINSFELEPIVKGDFLLTGDCSRVKATTEVTYYSKIINNKFIVAGSVGNYTPYYIPNTILGEYPDITIYWIASKDSRYTIMDDYSKDKNPADFVVFKDVKDDLGGADAIVNIHNKITPFAKIYLTTNSTQLGTDQVLLPYIFEKFTGIPKNLYTDNTTDFSSTISLKSSPVIKVIGSPEAVKLLTP